MTSAQLELLNPTRRLLVTTIKKRGEAAADELAGSCYLSVAAVRVHLNAVEKLGFLTHRTKRKGPGRPLHVYRLTEAGEALFPQSYAGMLHGVLHAVADSADCSQRIFDHLTDVHVASLEREVVATDLPSRMREIAEGETFAPFFPTLERTGERTWCISFGHCPVSSVACDYPEVCTLERRAVQAMVGDMATVRSATIRAQGDRDCTLIVEGRW